MQNATCTAVPYCFGYIGSWICGLCLAFKVNCAYYLGQERMCTFHIGTSTSLVLNFVVCNINVEIWKIQTYLTLYCRTPHFILLLYALSMSDFMTIFRYLLEQSLSVDNLFVFVLIFKYFKVPTEYQVLSLSKAMTKLLVSMQTIAITLLS